MKVILLSLFSAELSLQIAETNEANINVQSKLSTAYKPETRYSCLITEIFDCALLGEDAIRSILDAHDRLLKPGAKILPKKGRIYAQAGNLLADNLRPYRVGDTLIGAPAFSRRKPSKGDGAEPYEGKVCFDFYRDFCEKVSF